MPPKNAFQAPDYREPVNFDELALTNKELNYCLHEARGNFNFKNPKHLRALTKALLKRDFGIQLYLPENRLCPPVPIRWLYVQWIQNLLESTRSDFGLSSSAQPGHKAPSTSERNIVGLDIGVGASCIYPLIACATNPGWKMHGTEIDQTNWESAVHNVAANDLDSRIKLHKTSSPMEPLIPWEKMGVEKLDFTMCNPPFFASKAEAQATFEKDTLPHAACTGADVEMITEGGESTYISRMIDESKNFKEEIQWFTAQLGKLSSVHTLVTKLKAEGCSNYAISVLQPSVNGTARWALGWSWQTMRAGDEVARHRTLIGTGTQMEPNEVHLTTASDMFVGSVTSKIYPTLNELPLRLIPQEKELFVLADSAVWSRAEKRKRKREQEPGSETTLIRTLEERPIESSTYAFAVHVDGGQVKDALIPEEGSEPEPSKQMGTGSSAERRLYANKQMGLTTVVVKDKVDAGPAPPAQPECTVRVRWLKGAERSVFESFCGMLKRAIMTAGEQM